MAMTLDPNVPATHLRAYYRSNSSVCLICGDEQVKSALPIIETATGNVKIKVECLDCGSVWLETYQMSHIKMLRGG